MRKISTRLGAAVVLLLLAGAGCPGSSQPRAAASLTLSERAGQETRGEDPRASCRASFAYPVVKVGGGSEAARELMNVRLEEAVKRFLPSDRFESVEERAAATVDGCGADIASLARAEPGFAVGPWFYDLTYAVKRNDGRILSVALSQDTYTGGAHPNTTTAFLNFRTAEGTRIALEDLAADGRLADFVSELARRTLAAHGDALFDGDRAALDALARNPSDQAVGAYLASHSRFSLSVDALVLHFDPYEIAAYAAGPLEVAIPFSDLAGLIDPASL